MISSQELFFMTKKWTKSYAAEVNLVDMSSKKGHVFSPALTNVFNF